ncbi:MAG: FG-GAP repeat domain-containing protein [Vicinamibacteria bacterium]
MSLKPSLAFAAAAALALSANAFRLANGAPERVLEVQQAASRTLNQPTSAVVTRLSGAAEARLVVGAADSLAVFDATPELRPIATQKGAYTTMATGDLDGDGAEEVVTGESVDSRPAVRVRGGDLRVRWVAPLKWRTPPTRVVVVDLDGDGRGEVVAGNDAGELIALTPAGRVLWSHDSQVSGEAGQLRGLDDVRLPGAGRAVALARRGSTAGELAVLGPDGLPIASVRLKSSVRRLRTFDRDGDGSTELFVGCDDNWMYVYDASGKLVDAVLVVSRSVVEIRPAETDRNPKTREALAGDRDGNVAVVEGSGLRAQLNVGSRIGALLGADADADGVDEVFAGTEDGQVVELHASGRELSRHRVSGAVERMLALPRAQGEPLALAVISRGGVRVLRYVEQQVPVGGRAWLGVLPGALLVLAVALLRPGRVPTPAPAAAAAADVARRRIEEWIAKGSVNADAARRRLQELDAEAKRTVRTVAAPAPPPPPRGRR